MNDDDDDWRAAHPRARELLADEFFWETCNGYAPLGNDTGADTFLFYRKWRIEHPDVSAQVFLRSLLRNWEVPDSDWLVLDEELLKIALKKSAFAVLTRDDTIIGLAFSQLVVEGNIDAKIRKLAKYAIQRQALDVVISDRGWQNPAERKKRLAQMLAVIEKL